MTTIPTNSDDVIDSRDVIEAIEDLRAERDDRTTELDGRHFVLLPALVKLARQGADHADDWEYGATLVRDSYFVTYCHDLVHDCFGDEIKLPTFVHIDWHATARELRMDYTAVDFDGVTYWVR